MKSIGYSALIALGVVVLEWIFLSLTAGMFGGLTLAENLLFGIGIFLAFEIAFCTGLIISKLNHQKNNTTV